MCTPLVFFFPKPSSTGTRRWQRRQFRKAFNLFVVPYQKALALAPSREDANLWIPFNDPKNFIRHVGSLISPPKQLLITVPLSTNLILSLFGHMNLTKNVHTPNAFLLQCSEKLIPMIRIKLSTETVTHEWPQLVFLSAVEITYTVTAFRVESAEN